MPIINLPKLGPVRFADNQSPEEFKAQLQSLSTKYGFELPEDNYGYLGSFTKGVSRGATRMGETFGDLLPALGASALGFDEYAQRQMEEAAATERQLAEENPAQFESYKQVKGLGSGARYALETLGEVTPDIASMVVPGGLAGKVAGRGAAVLGAEALAKRKATAQGVGVYLGSFAMNAPEVFQSIYQDSGQLAPGASVLFGSVSAALDSVLPSSLLRSIAPAEKAAITGKILEKSGMRPGLAKNITLGAMKGVATEGLTEGAQQAINIAAEGFVNQNRDMWNSKDFNDIVESSIRGAIGGGVFGGVGGAAQNAQEKSAQQELQDKQLAEINAEREREAGIAAAAQQEQAARDDLASRRAAGDLGEQSTLFPEEAGPVRPEETEEQVAAEPLTDDEIKGLKIPKADLVSPALVPQTESLFGEKGRPTEEALSSVRLGALQQKEAEKASKQAEKDAAAAQKQALEDLAPKKFDIMQNVRMQDTGLSTTSKLQQLLEQAKEFGPKTKKETAAPEVPEAPSNIITDKTLQDLGVGKTAILRRDKVLEGKDVTKQEDVDFVHKVLDAYLDRPELSNKIAEKVDAYKQSLPPASTEVLKKQEAPVLKAKEQVGPVAPEQPLKPQLTAEDTTETSADQLIKENVPKVAAEFVSNFIKDSVKTDLDTEGVPSKAQGRADLEELETKLIQKNLDRKALVEDVITPIRAVNLLRESLDLRNTIDEETGQVNTARIAELEQAINNYGDDLPALYEQLKSATRAQTVNFFDQANAQAKEALAALVNDARVKAYPKSSYSASKDVRRVLVEETDNKNDLSALVEKRKKDIKLSKAMSVKEAAQILMSEIDKAIGKYGRAFAVEETPADVMKALVQLIDALVTEGIRSVKDATARIRAELGENIFRTVNKKDLANALNARLKQEKKESPKQVANQVKDRMSNELSIVDDVRNSVPEPASKIIDGAKNAMSNVPDSLRKGAFGFFSLPNMIELYGDKFPTLKNLLVALEQRGAKSTEYREDVSRVVREGSKLIKSLSPEMVSKFNNVTLELTRLKLDPRKATDATQPAVKQFKALPKDLQDYALKLANKYQEFGDKYIKFVTESIPQKAGRESLTLVEQMKAKFESNRIPFYLPLLRQGEYWVSFMDKDGERVVFARESQRELDQLITAIKAAGGTQITPYTQINQIDHKSAPPTGFMAEIVKDLQLAKVDDTVINNIYQSYLSLFPAESLKQHFQQRKGEKGFDVDVVQGFAAVGSRMAHQLSNLEYAQDIGNAINGVREVYESERTMLNRDIYENIKDQEQFLANPTPAPWASNLSYFSYFWYITGNISSAVVNLSQLPIVVYSVLGGKYGWNDTFNAMTKAMGMYFKGGKDNNSDYLADWTFGANAIGEYADLYKQAVDRSAIRRGVGYDLTEMRKVQAEDYTGVKAKVEHTLGYLFQNSERFNREVTLIATYDLARKSGMSKQEAIEEAFRINTSVHSHALADAGPRFFQNNIGKVMFTFKRFAQAQIALLGMLSRQALKGESAEVRSVARKQLSGIFGAAYMFSGVQGMPLYGAAEVIASMFNAVLGDDDEPFDMAESVRESIGDLGYKGPVNQLFNVDIASRTGFNGMVWRDDPRRLAEVGPVVYTIEHLMGPAYSAFMNAGRAYDQFKKGQTERAVESLMPSFVKNGMKGVRYASEGALNSKGVPIVDDISSYNVMMQIFGFTPADLSEAYARAGAMKEAEKSITDRRGALLDALYLAKTNGDYEGVVDINEKITTFNAKHPEQGLRIDESTKKRSEAARNNAMKDSVDGVHLNPRMKQYLTTEYGS